MAEALLGVVLENLIPLIQSEFAAFFGIKEKTEDLSQTLALIKVVLDDAEEKQWSNPPIKIWLQQLKDAIYVLDDILDKLRMESPQLECLSSFKPNNIMLCCKVRCKLNEIIRRLDRIAEVKNKYLLRECVGERQSEVAEWRQTSSTIAGPEVYGRDEDKEKVVEFLVSRTQNSEFLSVYPIVGLGGIGKTTLAQLVYNDERVSNHFNIKIWLCISENFNVSRILCSIVQSITKDKYEMLELHVMEQRVKELLQGKRYLLILDDVWIRNQQLEVGLSEDKWDQLKSILSCGSIGASIIVSTRDKDVAAIMGTCQAHDLTGLSDDDCWSLFKQRAIGLSKEGDEELMNIGKEIVKKCGGLPLAAKALGGLMRSRNTKKEWLEVKESSLWTLPNENHILPALRLSYFHLPPTLKQCFAFCAIYPKDTEIQRQELIHLWMANEFISSRANLDIEEVGNMIWNELYNKSFFQDVKINDDSGRIYFKMHDLVHDLAKSIAEQECMCLEKANLSNLPRNSHHIGFECGGQTETPLEKGTFEKFESLRTLYQLKWDGYFQNNYDLFAKNSSLRVLCTKVSKFPSLGNFSHLRYLGLCGLDVKTIPASIYRLHKLEILKLMKCGKLCSLPKHLTRLHNLRHLILGGCDSLSHMCPDIHKLSQLRTLSVYIVESEKGHSLVELRDLNLGGQLRIQGLENVVSAREAQDANLKDKEDVQELRLSWESAFAEEEVLEALQPHSNLKRLEIVGYGGINFPTWMGNSSALNNLVYLLLQRCKNCRQLPSLGRLPSLRKLDIWSMDDVRYIDEDETYDGVVAKQFPSLEELRVFSLPNLEQLLKRETTGMFPSLSILQINKCPKLQLPCLPHVTRLFVFECSDELLRSICNLNGLNQLHLRGSKVSYFPEGMMDSMASLADLQISFFSELKELPYDITKLSALSDLSVSNCGKLECLPEQGLEGLSSLRHLTLRCCEGLVSLPEGVRQLTSLQSLTIEFCPALIRRCVEGTGEDWHKIAHIPKVILKGSD
ncbi:hypothetical protein PIB30_014715 [Stylosanthes scabra]|uniref:P-loop containing nucleoside triphosphate hydrolase, leucine-rich repeat domain, L n=1 Tax=Stylosanthes scabra TaxID=79078 RepID=A0ABU6WAC7_9FABA|nr:hypothetical protein [Stylosanthes scabra]